MDRGGFYARRFVTWLIWFVSAPGLVLASAQSSYGAGKYVLAYQREIGYYENHDPPGNHSAYVHAWAENGSPKAGVSIRLPDGSEVGVTDTYGFVEIPLWTGGDYDVGNTAAGEWLKYRLKAGGKFRLSIRYAGAVGGTCHLEIDGANVTGPIALPATGGGQVWQTWDGTVFTIATADHAVKFVEDSGGYSVNYFVLAPATGPVADFDGDADVDLSDFSFFQACFNGPNRSPGVSSCNVADFDGDADVDLDDFQVFQTCFNGPNRPAACP